MPCECKNKKTYLRIYSANKDSGTFTIPVFNITPAIENITAFQVKQFLFNDSALTGVSIKINSRELSNLTSDTIQGSYPSSTQTIHEVNVAIDPTDSNSTSPKFVVQNGRLNQISFNMLNQDGVTYDAQFDVDTKWSILICFYH